MSEGGNRNASGLRRHRPRPAPSDASSEETGSAAAWFVGGMAAVAVACLLIGCIRRRPEPRSLLLAGGSLLTGLSFLAIGLLEWEWLERVVGFLHGLSSGVTQWFWTSSFGTLAESELVGRSRATVIWVVIGFPIFVWGCLLALRVVEL